MNRWGLLGIVCCAQIVAICLLSARTRAIGAENAALRAAPKAAVAAADPKFELLQKENARLKRELARIPELSQERARLQEETKAAEEIWSQHADALQTAIDAKRRDIANMHEAAKESEKARAREKAAARLAEKGPIDTAERERLTAILQQLGSGAKAMMEARQEFKTMEKTPENREAFKARMGAAWSGFDGALKQLGPDFALLEEVPVAGTDVDFATTPAYRSILPDSSGLKATVYLDGRVAWER